jgi:hypothetical protein
MTDGFVLDTPEQINMWVLLSRRSQLKLQMKGIKTPGLVKWCKANIPGAEKARTAKDCVVPVEYAISEAGGPPDYSLVNVHVMVRLQNGFFRDEGIFSTMAEVEAIDRLTTLYMQGRLELVYTLDEPRPPTKELYVPA